MTTLAIAVVVLLALGPLTIWGVRIGRRYRRVSSAAMSLLLMFGLNVRVDPPPPPRIEAQDPEVDEAKDDEPK